MSVPSCFVPNERALTTARQALALNGLTVEDSPLVDMIDALVYDGGFTAEVADAIVLWMVAQ